LSEPIRRPLFEIRSRRCWPAVKNGVMRLTRAQFEAPRRLLPPETAVWHQASDFAGFPGCRGAGHWYSVTMSAAGDMAELATLRTALEAERNELAAERATRLHLEAEMADQKETLLREMRRARFGPRSEKLHPDQLALALEEIETAIAEARTGQDNRPAAKAGKSSAPERPKPHRALPADLPRVERVIEPEDRHCACGCGDMVQIGEDRAHRLDVVPARYRVAELLKRSGKFYMDETTIPVLDSGRGKTKTGYLWAMARDDRPWGGAEPPGVVFSYIPGRACIAPMIGTCRMNCVEPYGYLRAVLEVIATRPPASTICCPGPSPNPPQWPPPDPGSPTPVGK
jgi:hypothetical protein